jgi:hypothetical protein
MDVERPDPETSKTTPVGACEELDDGAAGAELAAGVELAAGAVLAGAALPPVGLGVGELPPLAIPITRNSSTTPPTIHGHLRFFCGAVGG